MGNDFEPLPLARLQAAPDRVSVRHRPCRCAASATRSFSAFSMGSVSFTFFAFMATFPSQRRMAARAAAGGLARAEQAPKTAAMPGDYEPGAESGQSSVPRQGHEGRLRVLATSDPEATARGIIDLLHQRWTIEPLSRHEGYSLRHQVQASSYRRPASTRPTLLDAFAVVPLDAAGRGREGLGIDHLRSVPRAAKHALAVPARMRALPTHPQHAGGALRRLSRDCSYTSSNILV